MNEQNQINEPAEIKKLLEQNLELTEEIYIMTKKIKGYLFFQRLVSLFYLFLIIAPIILGIIYLPPLLGGLYDQYKDLLGIQAGVSNPIESLLKGGTGDMNLNNLSPQIQELLNNPR
ncbi:hypothetical protein HY797_01325 [Candidatus Falkowbacteria bacterium]|nr:hypothetical protein [Candidatus Falkowbacteria bacterium]